MCVKADYIIDVTEKSGEEHHCQAISEYDKETDEVIEQQIEAAAPGDAMREEALIAVIESDHETDLTQILGFQSNPPNYDTFGRTRWVVVQGFRNFRYNF
jgi:hypothetical protein